MVSKNVPALYDCITILLRILLHIEVFDEACLLHLQYLALTSLQVFIAGEYVGGAAELKTLQKEGKLGQLLAQSSSPALPKDLQEIIAHSKARAQVQIPGFTDFPMGS